MAQRILKEAKPDGPDRVGYGFRLAVSRAPTEFEAGRVLAYYQQELAHFRGDKTAALEVLGYRKEITPESNEKSGVRSQRSVGGDPQRVDSEKTAVAKAVPPANAPELAAWTMVSNVLLNLDETITKE